MYSDDDYPERGESCCVCGGEVQEEWHAYCSDCYAEEMGWAPRSPNRAELDRQRDYRQGFRDGFNAAVARAREGGTPDPLPASYTPEAA